MANTSSVCLWGCNGRQSEALLKINSIYRSRHIHQLVISSYNQYSFPVRDFPAAYNGDLHKPVWNLLGHLVQELFLTAVKWTTSPAFVMSYEWYETQSLFNSTYQMVYAKLNMTGTFLSRLGVGLLFCFEKRGKKQGLHCHLCCWNCTGGCSYRSAARSSKYDQRTLGRQSV